MSVSSIDLVLYANSVFYTDEGRRLLSNQATGEDSEEEDLIFASSSAGQASLPPTYSSPEAATLVLAEDSRHLESRLPETHWGGGVRRLSANDAPPDYSLHAPKGDGHLGKKAGMAVQIQIDGKLVPGTVMEDVRKLHK